jgi:citrate lyase subunit beta / citryl-CoA lyase
LRNKEKSSARVAIVEWLTGEKNEKVLIRINDASTPWYLDDLALFQHFLVQRVMLPKCESALQISAALAHLPARATVHALIENASAMGVLNEIARAPGVACWAIGSLD